VTGDTFLVMIEKNALHHVPVGKIFQLHGAPPHFSRHVHAFLDRGFPDRWVGKGGSIPWSSAYVASNSNFAFHCFLRFNRHGPRVVSRPRILTTGAHEIHNLQELNSCIRFSFVTMVPLCVIHQVGTLTRNGF
jgi:hypothetical protein